MLGLRPCRDSGKAVFVNVALGLLVATTAMADFTGRVVGITDGDTGRVPNDGQAVKIRLHGIDASE